MPPIQASVRGSLLTGASALALSITGYGAQAQTVPGQNPSPWTVWVEAGAFWTGGGNINVLTLNTLAAPFVTDPYLTFAPQGGWEGAYGFDYNWAGPWHAVFDFRAGVSRSSSQGSSSHSTNTRYFYSTGYFSSSNSSQSASERELHIVADFMIGREFGLGLTTGQFQLGVRVAELNSTINATQTASQFFSTFKRFGGTLNSSSSSQTASAMWDSDFFGAGPRAAVVGNTPIVGLWSVDYSGGIAGLIGSRTLNYSVTVTPGGSYGGSYRDIAFVFNADTWAALSYALSPSAKLSLGIRADYYTAPLMTYNTSTGAISDIDRLFWGPFLRLTGRF